MSFFRLDGALLDLAGDARSLEALATVQERWDDIRAHIDGFEGVAEFLTGLTGDGGGALQQRLDQIDLAGLRADLDRLVGRFNKLDSKYGLLLDSIKDFDEDETHKDRGLVRWQIAGDRQGPLGREEASFALAADAAVELEAGDTWPANDANVPDPLLRIGFKGGFEADAKAKLPFASGTVGLAVAAERDARIDYFFAPPSDGVFARCVGTRIVGLPSPLDLPGVWTAFEESDLAGLVVAVTGKSSFAVDVAIAEPLALAAGRTAALGLTFKARVLRRGVFHLRLRKLATRGETRVSLTLERARDLHNGREVGLGIEIDAAELSQRLHEVIAEHEREVAGVLAEYRDLLSPGTYLQQRAQGRFAEVLLELTDSEDARSALSSWAARLLGQSGQPSEADLRTVFDRELAAAFDGATGVVTDAIANAVADVQEALAARLGLPPDSLGSLEASLQALVLQVREDLEARVTEASSQKLAELSRKLDAVGAKVSGAATAADRAFERVRDVFGRYEQALERLKGVASTAAKQKIAAALNFESLRERSLEVQGTFVFSRRSPDVIKAFDHIVHGDFAAVLALLTNAPADIELDERAKAAEFVRLRKGVRRSLVMLDFEAGTSLLFDANAQVVVDGTGDVSVVSGATWKKRTDTPREDREVKFVDAYRLAAAKQSRELSIDLAISHEDEGLKRRELEGLTRCFEDAGLLPVGTTTDALHVLERWLGAGEERRIAADVQLAVRFDGEHIAPLLRLSSRGAKGLNLRARKEIFACAIQALISAEAWDDEDVMGAGQVVDRQVRDVPTAIAALFELDDEEDEDEEDEGEQRGRVRGKRQQRERKRPVLARKLHKRGMALVGLIDTMGAVYESKPGHDGWNAERYVESQAAMRDCYKMWLRKTGSRLFWIAKDLKPSAVAFVHALVSLARAEGVEPAALTLTMTKRAEPAETVLLGVRR